jgi:hypothetical protein
LRFEKIIDLLFSSVLPHGVSWYDACEVSPPVVVVSGRCWWSAVVAHAVVVERGGVFQFQKTEDDGNNFRFLSK